MGEGDADEVDKDYEVAVKLLEDLEFKKMMNNEEDILNAVIEINPGAGGTESQDWADILNRMYIMGGENGLFC